LDLKFLDIRLQARVSLVEQFRTRSKHTKRTPSRRLKQSSITTSSSLPKISEILPAIHLRSKVWLVFWVGRIFGTYTYFFITSTLTFCMSTFWLNSGGNFVDFNNFASTLLAIVTALRTRSATRGVRMEVVVVCKFNVQNISPRG
jgi:hypothetical protein